jgi:rubrerythrin
MAKNLNDLLDTAIQDEIAAQKFYLEAREKTNNAKLKDFFNTLANEEKGHERLLIGVKEMELYDGALQVDDDSLSQIEGAHQIPDLVPMDDMTMEWAMEIAMIKESKAAQVYGQLAETSPEVEIMKLFTSIASDERRHFKMIEEHYKILTGQMGWEA